MLFATAVLSLTVSAQQLTNSDFESWTGGKLTGWSMFSFGAANLCNITQSTDDPEVAKTANYQAFSIPISNMSGIPATEIIVLALTAVEDETVNHFTPLLLDDLTLQYASGLEELDLISSVSLFPNPTSGEFRIDVPMGSRVAVSDALGRRVMEINSYNGETLRLDNKGVYFVDIDNRLTKKLIVE